MAEGDIFSIDSSEMDSLVLDFKFWQVWGKHKARDRLNYWADVAQAEIRSNASHAPGPRVRTGNYVRSIMARRGNDTGDEYTVYAYSRHPAAHRLEYGFVGRDSLGRIYSQHPFPHFGPAMIRLAPIIHKDLADQLVKWWNQ